MHALNLCLYCVCIQINWLRPRASASSSKIPVGRGPGPKSHRLTQTCSRKYGLHNLYKPAARVARLVRRRERSATEQTYRLLTARGSRSVQVQVQVQVQELLQSVSQFRRGPPCAHTTLRLKAQRTAN